MTSINKRKPPALVHTRHSPSFLFILSKKSVGGNKKGNINVKKVNDIVYSHTTKFGGSISAEHGIGQLRKDDLKKYKSRFELEKMKSIKKIFDPFDIFNPGKIF